MKKFVNNNTVLPIPKKDFISNNIPLNNSINSSNNVITNPKLPKVDGLMKWVPLILSAAAIGVTIIALKEIKNVRKELMNYKKENFNKESSDPNIIKKMEMMDEQIRKISKYISALESNQNNNFQKPKEDPPPPVKKPEFKNVINNTTTTIKKEPVEVSNNTTTPFKKEPVEVINTEDSEYEYEEVTDDEEE